MKNSNSDNNKRIAKNTAYLYIRMLLTAFISLYTARVVLQAIGVEDFGIYNVVGGVVTFLGFLTASMSSATQRYLAFYLGKQDYVGFSHTFSMLVNIYLIFCAIAFLILEIVGPIYINFYMEIPRERVLAAQIVYQFSLFTFLLSTFSIPYRSSIVAYEKMGFYAFVAVFESVLHLAIAIGISHFSSDHLVIYGGLMLLLSVIITICVVIYCLNNLSGCQYKKYWDGSYFKELISYAGWNLFGSVTGVMNIQGQAIVLNYFFGPIVNAAKAIADRINSMISQFSNNFYMAVAPQIIKSYAKGDIEYTQKIVLNSSRYSFFMLFIVSVPIFLAMKPLLDLWLGKEQVTYDMVVFSQCTIIYMLVNVLEQPITMAVRATGDIKKYQIIVGSITLSFIPFCILLFIIGVPAYYSILLLSLIYLIAHVARVFIVCPIINITPVGYIKSVLTPIAEVLLVVVISFLFLKRICFITSMSNLILYLVVTLVGLLAILFLGIREGERKMILMFLKNRFFNK